METVLAAGVVYAVTCGYLAIRGVGRDRILAIVAKGLLGGLALSASIGVLYFLVVLQKPAQTFAVFSVIALLFVAARDALAEILDTITPLGIVLLNVAVNVAPWPGPVPLSLVWFAASSPVAPGIARTALNLVVLYAPALLALWLQWRGPPGNPGARFVLGAWVCWIGIAAVIGPGWTAFLEFEARDPASWVASALAAYFLHHTLMLALNLLASATGKDDDAARSIARSVHVDRMPLPWVIGVAAAFGILAYAFRSLAIAWDFEVTSTILVAAAFGIGSLAARRWPTASRQPAPGLSPAGPVTILLLAGAVAGLGYVQGHLPPSGAASGAPTAVAQEPQAAPELMLHYPESDLHAELKSILRRDGVPFTLQRIGGREYVRVEREHREAAQRSVAEIEGPASLGHNAQFRQEGREREFTAWLDRHGVGWRKVRRRHDHFLVWDDGPHHGWLLRAFDDEREAKSAGVDYHALYVRLQDPAPLALDGIAAFVSAEHLARFSAWVRDKGVALREVERDGRRFVHWNPPPPGLMKEYISWARDACWRAEREKRGGAPVPAAAC